MIQPKLLLLMPTICDSPDIIGNSQWHHKCAHTHTRSRNTLCLIPCIIIHDTRDEMTDWCRFACFHCCALWVLSQTALTLTNHGNETFCEEWEKTTISLSFAYEWWWWFAIDVITTDRRQMFHCLYFAFGKKADCYSCCLPFQNCSKLSVTHQRFICSIGKQKKNRPFSGSLLPQRSPYHKSIRIIFIWMGAQRFVDFDFTKWWILSWTKTHFFVGVAAKCSIETFRWKSIPK